METIADDFGTRMKGRSGLGNAARVVGAATLVSGTLDAIAAVVVFVFVLGDTSIMGVLQLIASGVHGEAAFSMGVNGAAQGVFFHYLIALVCSILIYALYNSLVVLRNHPVFSGLAYGGYVWVFMNFFVLPLSNVVQGRFEPGVALTGFVWHMALVGLPIVLITKKGFESASHA